MARNKVEVVKYPNVPKTKSEIDEEYIVAFVKDKNEEQWYIETMKEAKKEENPIIIDTSKPKICPKCGTKLYPSATTCFLCGTKLL